ncbi:hypothetical protein POTOM_037026 [Populus tomentosa]|uniref:Uncharacterized protein n=1 Tax=Populus tomentosa TaxID=118781 RepID=A0A8X7Z5E4_POPTO|nr:hypothetical protein POTOM_037026 [Populus tomentosa]
MERERLEKLKLKQEKEKAEKEKQGADKFFVNGMEQEDVAGLLRELKGARKPDGGSSAPDNDDLAVVKGISASVDSFPILTLNDLDPEFVLSLLVDALDDFMWQFLLLHRKPADLPATNFLQDH